jgi:hypothetical protein
MVQIDGGVCEAVFQPQFLSVQCGLMGLLELELPSKKYTATAMHGTINPNAAVDPPDDGAAEAVDPLFFGAFLPMHQ